MSIVRDTQYITPPPDYPAFMYKSYKSTWDDMMKWANKEWKDRLIYLASRGYWKELKNMNENSSPMRLLAESHGFRKHCANLTKEVWNQFSMRERVFIRRSYELRDLLLR